MPVYDTPEKRDLRSRVLRNEKLKHFSDMLRRTGNKIWCIIANREMGEDGDYIPGIDDGEQPNKK